MIETPTINTIEDVLRQSGVTDKTLTNREKELLDRYGYLVLPNVIDDDWLDVLRTAFETAIAQGGRHGAHVNLAWSEEVFDGIYTQPKVLTAIYHLLGRAFRAFPPVGRDPVPGQGLQALHPDWGRAASEPCQAVTVLWLIDEFTATNGATRVVPGSHLIPKPVPKAMLQPEKKHPDQKVILAEAGSALVFSSHLLHSGTRNESDGHRRILQCQFRGREIVLPSETALELPERLSPLIRYLLGEGIDFNQGNQEENS
jgi:ectoine hydroxylase-related dioxygenase (phytanoyl-CoA dioxygenase family)